MEEGSKAEEREEEEVRGEGGEKRGKLVTPPLAAGSPATPQGPLLPSAGLDSARTLRVWPSPSGCPQERMGRWHLLPYQG